MRIRAVISICCREGTGCSAAIDEQKPAAIADRFAARQAGGSSAAIDGKGVDGRAAILRYQDDSVDLVSNGAAWHIVSRSYDPPITGWASPDGSGFNRGVYNSDEIFNVGWEYNRDVINAINYRLLSTRDVLRALILDLKIKEIVAS